MSGLPFSSPGDLPDPEIEPGSPVLQADSLPKKLQGNSKDLTENPLGNLMVCNLSDFTVRTASKFYKLKFWGVVFVFFIEIKIRKN